MTVLPQATRRRADLVLVERGLFDSRAQARAAIEAGRVEADGVVLLRPSDRITADASLMASPAHPFVSRGGVKLAAALDAFAIDPTDCRCLDVGASTGGFTDVLLRNGATAVTAIDVGRGQLHPRIAAEPRVRAFDGVDGRALDGIVPMGSVDLATIDVSFISLRLLLPHVARCVKKGGYLVALAKPQFEVGRGGLGKGGIVRDDDLRDAVIDRLVADLPGWGLRLAGRIASPIAGGDGNQEVLLGTQRV